MKRSHSTRSKKSDKHTAKPREQKPLPTPIADHPSGASASDYPADSPMREQMASRAHA